MNKLENIETTKKNSKENENQNVNTPPTNDDLELEIIADFKTQKALIEIKLTKPGWVIRSAMLFSDSFFEGGSMVVHPKASENSLSVPLLKQKNTDEKIEMKILVGQAHNSPFFYVI